MPNITSSTQRELLILKSKKTQPRKALLIFLFIILVFTIASALLVRNAYYDAIELYFSLDSLQDLYPSAHDYAMEDRFYFFLPIYFGILAIVGVIFALRFTAINNAYILITNNRIIGRNSYGDKFNYNFSKISSSRMDDKKVRIQTTEGRELVITHIDNPKQIVDRINDPDAPLDTPPKALPQKYIQKFENVTNSTKKEATIFGLISVCVAVGLLALIGWFFSFGISQYRSKEFSDVFEKNPATWTESEEAYVNDLFEWMDDNN